MDIVLVKLHEFNNNIPDAYIRSDEERDIVSLYENVW